MKVIKTYIAEDGKEFDTEIDCVQYEEKLKANQFRQVAFLFDEEGRQLELSDQNFNDAVFIHAATDEAAEYMAEEFRDWETPWYNCGMKYKRTAGTWYFDDTRWVPAEDYLKVADILKKIMNK